MGSLGPGGFFWVDTRTNSRLFGLRASQSVTGDLLYSDSLAFTLVTGCLCQSCGDGHESGSSRGENESRFLPISLSILPLRLSWLVQLRAVHHLPSYEGFSKDHPEQALSALKVKNMNNQLKRNEFLNM